MPRHGPPGRAPSWCVCAVGPAEPRGVFLRHPGRHGIVPAMIDESLVSAWPRHPALFLDLDGTLIEFAEVPHGVELSGRLRDLLERFAALEDYAVAFVSGRTIEELDSLLAPHRFALAGVHGNQRRGFDGLVSAPGEARELDPSRAAFRKFAADHPGVVVEEKRIGVALHFRQRPELAGAVRDLGLELARVLPSGYEILQGKMMIEIKPADLDKGEAIREFMREAPFAGRTPVFIGDDVTDEAGFRAVNELGGLSVKVNHGSTAAKWRLPNVDAVLSCLERVLPARGEADP
ncbi:MAG TPA: trehalose-phosphatase [Gammaproteobacteria bacterium]